MLRPNSTSPDGRYDIHFNDRTRFYFTTTETTQRLVWSDCYAEPLSRELSVAPCLLLTWHTLTPFHMGAPDAPQITLCLYRPDQVSAKLIDIHLTSDVHTTLSLHEKSACGRKWDQEAVYITCCTLTPAQPGATCSQSWGVSAEPPVSIYGS